MLSLLKRRSLQWGSANAERVIYSSIVLCNQLLIQKCHQICATTWKLFLLYTEKLMLPEKNSWPLCWKLFTDKKCSTEWCISKHYAGLGSWRFYYLMQSNQEAEVALKSSYIFQCEHTEKLSWGVSVICGTDLTLVHAKMHA